MGRQVVEYIKDRISEYNSIVYLLRQHLSFDDPKLLELARAGNLVDFKARLIELTKAFEHLSKDEVRELARVRSIYCWNKSKRLLIGEIIEYDARNPNPSK